MKKTLQFLGALVCAILLLGIGTGRIFARITGTQPTDADVVCWGVDGAELCVIANGSLVSTTDNDTTLGTAALRFATVNAVQVTASSMTVSSRLLVTMPAAETIAAAGTITADACGSIKRITSTAARTTSTTNTFTAPAAANVGCIMDVVNVSTDAITLDYNILFNSAAAADVVLGTSDTVRVGSTGAGGAWYQIGGTGNN